MVVYESENILVVEKDGKLDVIQKIIEQKHELVLDAQGFVVERDMELRSRAV